MSVLFVRVKTVGRASRKRAGAAGRVGTDRFARGWSGPAGVTIRSAKSDETASVSELADAAGTALSPSLRAALVAGVLSRTLKACIRSGREEWLKPLTRAVQSGDLSVLHELSLVLVAERDGVVVGEVSVSPAMGLMQNLIDDGVAPVTALSASHSLAKVTSLATAPGEDSGLRAALLQAAVETYDEAGYNVLYSSAPAESEALSTFTDHGFDLVPLGHQVSLWLIFGEQISLKARDGEQMVVRMHDPENRPRGKAERSSLPALAGTPHAYADLLSQAAAAMTSA